MRHKACTGCSSFSGFPQNRQITPFKKTTGQTLGKRRINESIKLNSEQPDIFACMSMLSCLPLFSTFWQEMQTARLSCKAARPSIWRPGCKVCFALHWKLCHADPGSCVMSSALLGARKRKRKQNKNHTEEGLYTRNVCFFLKGVLTLRFISI